MRRLLLAALLAAAGCAAPDQQPRIPDNDPMAAWHSEEGPYRRGDPGPARNSSDLRAWIDLHDQIRSR